MQYVKIAKAKDFDKTRMKSFRILARHVGVFKAADGAFYAMEAGCKHQNAGLSEGRIEGEVVTCRWHGWKYDLRTGECVWGSEARLHRYGCKVENGDIYITMHPFAEGESEEDLGER